jgi:peptidoglycan hydrolase-like protein with peptidoglycan-binding domain
VAKPLLFKVFCAAALSASFLFPLDASAFVHDDLKKSLGEAAKVLEEEGRKAVDIIQKEAVKATQGPENSRPKSDDPVSRAGRTKQLRQSEFVPLRRAEVREMQRLLNRLGFDVGTPDGLAGKRTKRAIREFQAENGMSPDGRVSRKVLNALRGDEGGGGTNTADADSQQRSLPRFDHPLVRKYYDERRQALGGTKAGRYYYQDPLRAFLHYQPAFLDDDQTVKRFARQYFLKDVKKYERDEFELPKRIKIWRKALIEISREARKRYRCVDLIDLGKYRTDKLSFEINYDATVRLGDGDINLDGCFPGGAIRENWPRRLRANHSRSRN